MLLSRPMRMVIFRTMEIRNRASTELLNKRKNEKEFFMILLISHIYDHMFECILEGIILNEFSFETLFIFLIFFRRSISNSLLDACGLNVA